MPRAARTKHTEGYFSIDQSASEGLDLFRDEADRCYFLDLLRRAQRQQGFVLLAYCMKQARAYQLVVQLKGADLSKLMKSLNISYAMYRKAEQSLFKDRFKSRQLASADEAAEAIGQLTCKREGHSEWTQYCVAAELTPEQSACLLSLKEAQAWLEKQLASEGILLSDLKKDKERRNRLMLELRRQSSLGLKEIGLVFGGLSESSVCKVLKCSACEPI